MADRIINAEKSRHRRTVQERFELALARFPGEDPLFPAFMHCLERYLAPPERLSEIDQAFRDKIEQHPAITRELMGTLVQNWQSLGEDVKARFVPRELARLQASEPIDVDVLRQTVQRSFRRMPSPKPPSQWVGKTAMTVSPQQRRADSERMVQRQREPELANLELAQISLPTLTGTDPVGPQGQAVAYFGKPFSIIGEHFSTNNDQNTIILHGVRMLVGLPDQPVWIARPHLSSKNRLECVLPHWFLDGNVMLQVIVGQLASNPIPLTLATKIEPPANLVAVSPLQQYPGRVIILTAEGLGDDPRVVFRSDLNPNSLVYALPKTRLGASQIEVKVPEELVRYPGGYQVAITAYEQAMSNWRPVTVLPFKYKITFESMTCIDEQDMEVNGDELVTRWLIAADEVGFQKGTGQYSDFGDGSVQFYNAVDRDVFLPENGPGEVRYSLGLGTAIWEWDAGDADSFSKVINSMTDIVSTLPLNFGNWGVLIRVILSFLGKLISWFGGDPDNLGAQERAWNSEQLLQLTGLSGQFTEDLLFMNDDDTGSYKLRYHITRFPI